MADPTTSATAAGPAEQFERDYGQGRVAGMSDALDFIHAIAFELPTAVERALVMDKIWYPLQVETNRVKAERDARYKDRGGRGDG